MKSLARLALVASLIALPTAAVLADNHSPVAFHWSMHPADAHVKSYEFDISRGHWTASLISGNSIVSDEGRLSDSDRSHFYDGLESSGAWRLQTSTASAAHQPHYRYTVTRYRDQHEAEFTGTPGSDYGTLLKFVNSTVVGHEQQVLMQKLGAPSTPAATH